MGDLKRVKKDIAELAQRQKSVRFEEIERIVNQLGNLGYSISARPFPHGTLFRVANRQFSVTRHNRGSSQIRSCYVRQFLEAMAELELYED